jgi:hypothetical protein
MLPIMVPIIKKIKIEKRFIEVDSLVEVII